MQHSKLHQITKYCLGNGSAPLAGKTQLGWVIYGGSSTEIDKSVHHVNECNCRSEADARLEALVRRNYSLESIGISSSDNTPISSSDKRPVCILESCLEFQYNSYQVELLWKF